MEPSVLARLSFLTNNDLNPKQKILFLILKLLSNYKKETNVYNKELSKMLDVHTNNISANLSILQQKGYIQIDFENDQFEGCKRTITLLKKC
jgi:DNA-binding MarR family transcriptional regulator